MYKYMNILYICTNNISISIYIGIYTYNCIGTLGHKSLFATLACKSIDTGLVGSVGLVGRGDRGACEACGACGASGAFRGCGACGGLGPFLASENMFRISYAC